MNWRGWLIKETRYHLQFILLLQCLKLVNLQLGPQTEYRNIWLQLILIAINYSYISIITDLAHSQLKQEKLGVSTCMKEVDLCENIQSNFQADNIVSILRLPHQYCVYIYQAKHELSNNADRFDTYALAIGKICAASPTGNQRSDEYNSVQIHATDRKLTHDRVYCSSSHFQLSVEE